MKISTTKKDINGDEIYENDIVKYKFLDIDSIGLILFGEYGVYQDGVISTHIGFHIKFDHFIDENQKGDMEIPTWMDTMSIAGVRMEVLGAKEFSSHLLKKLK